MQDSIDETTGLPASYDAVFRTYPGVVRGAAVRLGIPVDDIDDAVAEVQLKFWLKNGLEMFDPTRGTKFQTMYRSWTQLFLLQERDKSVKRLKHTHATPPKILNDEDSWTHPSMAFEDEWLRDEHVRQWLADAERALDELKRPDLVKLLNLCVHNAETRCKPPTYDMIAAELDCKKAQSPKLLAELRQTLSDLGMGMETLWQ